MCGFQEFHDDKRKLIRAFIQTRVSRKMAGKMQGKCRSGHSNINVRQWSYRGQASGAVGKIQEEARRMVIEINWMIKRRKLPGK